MDAKLYVIPGSHPSRTAMMMLERQGDRLQARRPDAGGLEGRAARASGFPGITVPALKIDGPQGPGLARDRPRARPARRPIRRCYPADPARARGRRAGRDLGRRGAAAGRRAGSSGTRCGATARPLVSYSEGARLGVPIGLAVKTGQPRSSLSAPASTRPPTTTCAPTSPRCRGCSQRIDDWIDDGVLGGEQLNAADLQIATSLRLLMTLQDLRAARSSPGRPASSRCASRRTTPATCRRSCRPPGSSRCAA